jgi:hypothetical protein
VQDIAFTPVNAPSSTDTKNGSACESLQSLELHVTALDWIMLLGIMVTERNLTECESNCLVWRAALQFGWHVTEPSWYMSSKITRRHMLEDSHFHIQCIIVYCVPKPLNISEWESKIKSFRKLNMLINSKGYCWLLLTCRLTMCVSGCVQVLPVDPVSYFHSVRYKLT